MFLEHEDLDRHGRIVYAPSALGQVIVTIRDMRPK